MGKYDARSARDAARLLESAPLVWLVSGAGEDFRATLMPVRPVTDDSGAVVRIQGHYARSNDQYRLLQRDPRAVVLALGAHDYVSPSWMADRTQAPTWNFASAQFVVDVEFHDDPARLRAHLDDLVGAMEAGRDAAWTVDETAQRYEALARRIVGFDARVVATRGRYKLGQDDRDDVYADIVRGLTSAGSAELLAWMKDFNPDR